MRQERPLVSSAELRVTPELSGGRKVSIFFSLQRLIVPFSRLGQDSGLKGFPAPT